MIKKYLLKGITKIEKASTKMVVPNTDVEKADWISSFVSNLFNLHRSTCEKRVEGIAAAKVANESRTANFPNSSEPKFLPIIVIDINAKIWQTIVEKEIYVVPLNIFSNI